MFANINFSLWLTGGLSQGCPDFQKVYVFKVYVPFCCPIFSIFQHTFDIKVRLQFLALKAIPPFPFFAVQCCQSPDPPILAFFVFLVFFVLRFSPCFFVGFSLFPGILRVRQSGKSLFFSGAPRVLAKAGIGGSGRFRKGVRGRGLATNSARNTAQIVPKNYVLLLTRGHSLGERVQKKGPESMV